jgi:hypothetical protein
MLAIYRNVKTRIPELRRNAGSKILFEAAIFQGEGHRTLPIGGTR